MGALAGRRLLHVRHARVGAAGAGSALCAVSVDNQQAMTTMQAQAAPEGLRASGSAWQPVLAACEPHQGWRSSGSWRTCTAARRAHQPAHRVDHSCPCEEMSGCSCVMWDCAG